MQGNKNGLEVKKIGLPKTRVREVSSPCHQNKKVFPNSNRGLLNKNVQDSKPYDIHNVFKYFETIAGCLAGR
jgi:hypothetical protein